MAASPSVLIRRSNSQTSFILPIDSEYELYSPHEFSRARSQPSDSLSAVAKPLSLREVRPPLDPGIDEQFMFYPTRAQFDPGSVWLRNLLLQTGHGLDRPKRRRSEPARARAAREPLSQTRFVAPGAAVVSSLDTSQRRT